MTSIYSDILFLFLRTTDVMINPFIHPSILHFRCCHFRSILLLFVMAPDPKKPQQNGQKKKGYNPYNKFKNRNWQKKKANNENSSKAKDGQPNQHHSHAAPASPVKVVQTPISQWLFRKTDHFSVVVNLATYINISEQPARYRGWRLYFPDTGTCWYSKCSK